MTVKRFSGKTSIITGGESGIGRSTAVLMAEEGANVYLTDIRNFLKTLLVISNWGFLAARVMSARKQFFNS